MGNPQGQKSLTDKIYHAWESLGIKIEIISQHIITESADTMDSKQQWTVILTSMKVKVVNGQGQNRQPGISTWHKHEMWQWTKPFGQVICGCEKWEC